MALPESVIITADTMREGLQIEDADIPVSEKLRLLDALGETGAKTISIGSFATLLNLKLCSMTGHHRATMSRILMSLRIVRLSVFYYFGIKDESAEHPPRPG